MRLTSRLLAISILWVLVTCTAAQARERIFYYHNDHLGTPQVMTDDQGTVVWSAEYEPFGKATITTATITNNLRFPGQYYDAETGLHYNFHRDYDPETGRDLTPDPVPPRPEDMNPYIYTGNNPINRTDPTGMQWFDEWLDCPIDAIECVADSCCPSGARLYYNCAKYRCIGYVDHSDPHGRKCKGVGSINLGPVRLRGPCTSQGVTL